MYIIGIDPGKTGAAAYITDGKLTAVFPFKGEIENCRLVGASAHMNKPTYFIERVTASPQMGVVSAFTFGKWADAVETTAILTGYPVHMVRPLHWQSSIGIYAGGDKNVLFDYAKKLFPEQYAKKMFNKATSDAVLIAYYGWRFMANQEAL